VHRNQSRSAEKATRRRTPPGSEPDLFSVEPAAPAPIQGKELSAEVAPRPTPARGAADIARLIAGWSDAELEQLRIVVANETRRRGHSPPEAARGQALDVGRTGAGPRVRRSDPDSVAPEIAPGQANAIRAAHLAGMRLGKIAKEFGVPLPAVKRLLAGSAPT
jgi:hypothetical protein